MKEIKTFQQMYRDGHVNRREFLAAMGALGVTAATAGSFLTSASALAATPTRGGSVIFASNLHGPDDTLDPLLGTSTIDYTRANAGEVLPTPASPFGQSYGFDNCIMKGWQLGSTQTGFYELDEYRDSPPEMCGFFGGYFYINLSCIRMQAVRNPAITVEQLDLAIFGDQPDSPNTSLIQKMRSPICRI